VPLNVNGDTVERDLDTADVGVPGPPPQCPCEILVQVGPRLGSVLQSSLPELTIIL